MTKKFILTLLFSLLMVGCATDGNQEREKLKRAAEINAQLGVEYMRQERYEVAKQKLERAMQQDPDNGDVYHYMAELYRRLDEFDLAESYFEKAMERNEDDSALLNNYGVFLCDRKQYKKAIDNFEKVLKNPVYQRKDLVYENMGICYQRQGNLFLAEKYLNKAYALNPRLPVTAINLAQLNFDKQLFDQANFHFQRFLTMSQHTPQSLWLGYLLESHNGNKNQAASYAVLLKGKYPDSQEAKLLYKMESRRRK
ncbi:MAG: type IV pilus biogenesis/stability protein PilW [Gammaproteobacteria bacterium]|jgi:type IV pilus assembly protein PilF